MKWWQQLLSGNQWAYDVSQPPLVYTGKVGGKTHRVVSVATMEGVWFAFDAATGTAVPRAREGDRPRRASAAPARAARDGLPVVARRPQLLAGGVRPDDELRLQRRGRDGRRADPEEADADAEEAEVRARRRVPRARERQLRRSAPELARPRLDQRDRRVDGPARLEVLDARAGARRRVADRVRASGSRAAAMASSARVRRSRRARCSGRSTPTRPIASGPTIFSAGGKEYVAVTVGGTPTSSNGGVASWLQVFALPGP